MHLFSDLLTADGAFDKGAIIRQAHAFAKQEQARAPLPGFAPRSYAAAFADNLKHCWNMAKAARRDRALSAAEIEARDTRASLLFAADMIDETARSFSARAAIEARF